VLSVLDLPEFASEIAFSADGRSLALGRPLPWEFRDAPGFPAAPARPAGGVWAQLR
jgi:hypothetical protein